MSMEQDNAEFDELAAHVANPDLPVKADLAVPVKAGDAIKRIRQKSFLQAYAECGIITKACDAAGINQQTERRWRTSGDKWYIEQFQDAYQRFQDKISDKVQDIALNGWEEPIVGRVAIGPGMVEDRIIGHKHRHDSLLLMFLAKRHMPQFKENYMPAEQADKPKETVSPMTRITIQLNMMEDRKKNKIIDITPMQPQITSGEIIDVKPEDTNASG